MDRLWKNFEEKGDIFSYLKYKKYNFDLETVSENGSRKSRRNSNKDV